MNARQNLYDGGAVKAQVRAAEIGREIGKEQKRGLEMQRIAAVASAITQCGWRVRR